MPFEFVFEGETTAAASLYKFVNIYQSIGHMKLSYTVKITFLSRDRDRPVTVPSPSRPRSFERRPPCVPRVQRSFSVPKRPLIFDRSIAF